MAQEDFIEASLRAEKEDNLKTRLSSRRSWEQDFEDFYWENGKYEGRELGILEHKKFIAELLKRQREKIEAELSNKITNN